jgi:hypothetical protein
MPWPSDVMLASNGRLAVAPPFVQLPAPMSIDNPIETAHRLALDFMDAFRRGAPSVGP